MQHITGIILQGSDVEIMEDESPGKGSYLGLHAVIFKGRKQFEAKSQYQADQYL